VGLTAEVAEFIVQADAASVPEGVKRLAKRSILDGLGLAVAGACSAPARLAQREIQGYGPLTGEASVLGTDLKVPTRFAAFLNGLAIHADDYDDTQLAVAADRVYGLLTHPTAPVLPAAIAFGQRDGRSGADVLISYLVGVEVETKVSEAIAPRHYEDGFHSTGTVGAIGSGAAGARAVGLDVATTAVALGIAASQAAGLREQFGTMTKPFHAGRAAESGVLAVSLAAAGFTGATNILEARRGFFRAAGGGYDEGTIAGKLGAPWTFESPGVSIKPHPSGSLTHPAMGAFSDLIHEHHLTPENVRHVRVGTNRHMPNALIHHRPTDGLTAKFSMEFCMAILLLDGHANLREFTDESVNRPDVRELIEHITFEADPVADADGYQAMTSIIDVDLVDGRALHTVARFGKGSPTSPMSDDELIDKFLGCLDWAGVSESVGRSVAERVLALEDEPLFEPVIEPLRIAAVSAVRA
jgi:2-methylcitrate dehydratase PrpD